MHKKWFDSKTTLRVYVCVLEERSIVKVYLSVTHIHTVSLASPGNEVHVMNFLTWYNSWLWNSLVRIPDYAKYDLKYIEGQ